MIRLTEALRAWGTPAFESAIKKEIERLDMDELPLQQELTKGNHVVGDGFTAMVIKAWDEPPFIRVEAGIFYSSMLTGCACADDPTPVNVESEYCELRFDIDNATGSATVVPIRR